MDRRCPHPLPPVDAAHHIEYRMWDWVTLLSTSCARHSTAVGLLGSWAGYKYSNAPSWWPLGRCGTTSKKKSKSPVYDYKLLNPPRARRTARPSATHAMPPAEQQHSLRAGVGRRPTRPAGFARLKNNVIRSAVAHRAVVRPEQDAKLLDLLVPSKTLNCSTR